MIVTVGGIKGGSGKTTVATNLACIAAGQGADVLLVDADNQETAFDFTNARKSDNPGAPAYTCVKLTGASVRTAGRRVFRIHFSSAITTVEEDSSTAIRSTSGTGCGRGSGPSAR